MIPDKLLCEVLALPVEDRLELFEHLRENLEHEPAAFPISDEVGRELDTRCAEFLAAPEEGLTLRELERVGGQESRVFRMRDLIRCGAAWAIQTTN
jgi:putative addiction module component (TIGR02574 family)